MDAKLVDTRRFSCTRNTTDTHTDAVAAIGQALVDDFLGLSLMVRIDTLHQRHSLREDRDVAFDDTLYHIGSREFTTLYATMLQIGIDDGRLLDTAIHLQAGIF